MIWFYSMQKYVHAVLAASFENTNHVVYSIANNVILLILSTRIWNDISE